MSNAGGWLNDVLINQVVHLINFYAEYDPDSKMPGAKVRLVCFGDSSTDNHKLNPRNLPSYNCISDDVPQINMLNHNVTAYRTKFKKEVMKWYSKKWQYYVR